MVLSCTTSRPIPRSKHNLAEVRLDIVAEMEARLVGWVDERLGDRPDPMIEVLELGLPAVNRLQRVIAEEAEATAFEADLAGLEEIGAAGGSHVTAKTSVPE